MMTHFRDILPPAVDEEEQEETEEEQGETEEEQEETEVIDGLKEAIRVSM
jgi:hypothetical protein